MRKRGINGHYFNAGCSFPASARRLFLLIIAVTNLAFPQRSAANKAESGAPVYEIDNGGTLILNYGSVLTINSTEQSPSSSARLIFSPAGTFEFGGTLSGFFGEMNVSEGKTAEFSSASAGWLNLSDSSNSLPAVLKITGNSSFSGGSSNSAVLNRYGVIHLSGGSLSLGQSLHITGSSGENPGKLLFTKVKFDSADASNFLSLQAQSARIFTDAPDGSVDLSKHFEIDLSSLSAAGLVPGNPYDLTLFRQPSSAGELNLAGAPVLTGNYSDNFENPVTVTDIGTLYPGYNTLRLRLTYSPLFCSDSSGYSSWSELIGSITENQTADLRKNHTMPGDYSVTKSFTLNLVQGRALNTGERKLIIDAGKTFSVKGTGSISGKISFGGGSEFALTGMNKFSESLYIDSEGGSGTVKFGDGLENTKQTLTPNHLNNFGGKVSKVVIDNMAEVVVKRTLQQALPIKSDRTK